MAQAPDNLAGRLPGWSANVPDERRRRTGYASASESDHLDNVHDEFHSFMANNSTIIKERITITLLVTGRQHCFISELSLLWMKTAKLGLNAYVVVSYGSLPNETRTPAVSSESAKPDSGSSESIS